MAKYPSQLQDKFNLRLPDGMKDAIAERAKENGRSINSEIVQILEDAINNQGISPHGIGEMNKVSFTIEELNRITDGIKDTLIRELEQNFTFTKKEKN